MARRSISPLEAFGRRMATFSALPLLLACASAPAAPGAATASGAAPASVVLQWPYAPLPAKLTFDHVLSSLAPAKRASAWHRFVYGREPRPAGEFVLPVAVAVAADGRIAVADLGRACVHLYVPQDDRYSRLVGTAERAFASPVGLAFDDQQRLYVSDSTGALFAFDAAGASRFVRTTFGGTPLLRPTGLAFAPTTRRLYLVDTLASRIDALTLDGELEFSFGHRGSGLGELNFPTHLFRAADGRLFVADSLNFRVAIFDESGAALGSFGHHGDGSGDLALPKGLAVDRDGVVYVADSVFDNLQLFAPDGDFLLTVGRRGTASGEFWLPAGVTLGGDGKLYVCDTYNHRVQVFRVTERYEPAAS